MRWWLLPMLIVMMGNCLAAEAIPQPVDYPQSLQRDLQALLDAHAQESRNPEVLTHLAALYLDMGDNLFNDTASRLAAYEEGARIARRALELQEANAEAHFLYAANLGTAAQLKGLLASALAVREIKAHTVRALELHKTHAPALHMMGMLLEELPWFLGGDQTAALSHVTRAVAIAPGFTHARLDLAKLYLKRGDAESAKRELRAIVGMERPDDPYAWTHRDRPEAMELLKAL
jgi:tetratricopeptide (TPR) repeat protein